MIAKILKYLGLYPVLGGGLLSRLVDLEFLTKADFLKGFLGVTPHLIALAVYAVAWNWARRSHRTLAAPAVAARRAAWSLAALILFGLCIVTSFTPLPETLLPVELGLYRWYAALAFYVAFYLCLGASMP